MSEPSTVVMRFSYEAGLLATGEFEDALAYGRSLGLDIQVHRGGGWLVRRGYVRVRGPGLAALKFYNRFRGAGDED